MKRVKVDWLEDSLSPKVVEHVYPGHYRLGDLVMDLDTGSVYGLRCFDGDRDFYEMIHRSGRWGRLMARLRMILFGPRRMVCREGHQYVLIGTALEETR